MTDLICPYCDTEQEASPDIHEPDAAHDHECVECEKSFKYYIEYTPHYTAWKADCMNGGDHDWRDVHSTARIAYKGVKQCRGCQEYNKQPNWKGEFEHTEKQLNQ